MNKLLQGVLPAKTWGDFKTYPVLVMNVKDLMQERSKANMEVTVASQRLIGADNQDGPIKWAGPIKAALRKALCRMHELLTVIDLKMEFENPNSEALKLDNLWCTVYLELFSSIDTTTYVVSSESFMRPGVPVVTPWR